MRGMNRAPGAVFCCLVATVGCLLATGCGNDDDSALWGDAMTPTQVQQANMGPGPTTEINPDDYGEDPYMSNPNYPFVEEPWEEND